MVHVIYSGSIWSMFSYITIYQIFTLRQFSSSPYLILFYRVQMNFHKTNFKAVNNHTSIIQVTCILHISMAYFIFYTYYSLLQKLAEGLKENKTLKTLNIESNFITGELLVEIFKAINVNKTLTELRAANQVWSYF